MPPILASIIPAVIGGIATAGASALKSNKEAKTARELKTINQTKPGFTDLGDELLDENDKRNLSFINARRPVIFPRY
mgnify:CR=1 FL=1